MARDFYTDAFAADVAQLRDPAWVEPDPEYTAKIRARLDTLADELADQLSARVRDLPAAAPDDAHLVVRDAGDWHLARLRALREIRTVAEQLADRTVAAAGTRGAGYPQLGDAWAITRQGARKKWPHAVSAPTPERARRTPGAPRRGHGTLPWGQRPSVESAPDPGGAPTVFTDSNDGVGLEPQRPQSGVGHVPLPPDAGPFPLGHG